MDCCDLDGDSDMNASFEGTYYSSASYLVLDSYTVDICDFVFLEVVEKCCYNHMNKQMNYC